MRATVGCFARTDGCGVGLPLHRLPAPHWQPFGVLAYYPAEQVRIAGEAKQFTRPTATGGTFDSFFCPNCGSTVYVRAGKHPSMLGIAVGAIADADFPAPVRSVWEQSMHRWVEMPEGLQRFVRGRG